MRQSLVIRLALQTYVLHHSEDHAKLGLCTSSDDHTRSSTYPDAV